MKKINNLIEKNIKNILITFLYIQPFIDAIAALTLNYLKIQTTISSIIRFIFLILCIYYLIVLNKTKKKNKNLILLSLIGIYIILFSIITIIYKNTSILTFELKNTINTFYLPIVLLAMLDMTEQYNIKIKLKTIIYIYIEYIMLIIIPTITNTGFESYWHSKVGTTGWFISANAVGNILSILMPLLMVYLIKNKSNKLTKIIIVIISLYIYLSIGTKVPVLSLAICTMFTLLYYIIEWIKNKKYKKLLLSGITTIIIVLTAIITIPKTSFYKNIEIHKNYLGINNFSEVLTNYKLIDHFIFSQRLTFLNNTNNNYKKTSIGEKVFGIGYIENYGTDNESTKTIEIDYFEIFYRNGIIGFIIYFIILTPVIIKTIKKCKEKTLINTEFKICITIILLLALFSGHVLVTPAVSIFVALILTIIQGGLHEKID